MLTQEQAIERLKQTKASYDGMRQMFDTMWTMAIAYDAGRQWSYTTSERGASIIKGLSNIIDPNRDDVRVTMNLIHEHVIRFAAALSPRKIVSTARPASGAMADRVVADVDNHILDRWLSDADGLRILREKDRIRFVLGTAIIRRTLQKIGKGRPVESGGEIADYKVGWAHVFPWEVIRDPSATSCRPDRDEEIFAHEKPRTTAWIARNYGVQIQTDQTLGSLMDYQWQIHAAHGIGAGYATDSKLPAVLVQETYFQDDDGDLGDWPWMMLSYQDPRNGAEITPFFFGRNPFSSFPFYLFTNDYHVQSPWGFGIPHALMAGQDLVNLAWTYLLRMQQSGMGKWSYEAGTITDPGRMLNNRIDQPIVWQRNQNFAAQSAAPTRIPPPGNSQVNSEMLAMTPDWMDKAVGTSQVMQGITSKRGESGQAVEAKIAQAGLPLDQLRADDDLIYNQMLYETLVDLTDPRRLRLDTARKMAGPDISDDQIFTLIRHPTSEAVKAVEIVPAAVHPKTQGEVQDSTIALTNAQIIEPETARWNLTRSGITVDQQMMESQRKQEMEIEAMLNGQPQPMNALDNDDYHLRVLRLFVDSPKWLTASDQAKQLIQEHGKNHYTMQMWHVQQQRNPQQPTQTAGGQPSPSAEATAAAGQVSPGAMNPAISAA